jgi:hypothetical protein
MRRQCPTTKPLHQYTNSLFRSHSTPKARPPAARQIVRFGATLLQPDRPVSWRLVEEEVGRNRRMRPTDRREGRPGPCWRQERHAAHLAQHVFLPSINDPAFIDFSANDDDSESVGAGTGIDNDDDAGGSTTGVSGSMYVVVVSASYSIRE